jgi:uncharacterized protein (UPF0335 family)
MDLQQTFYLVAIISLGLMAIFLVFVLLTAASIGIQIKRILRRIETIGEETRTIVENVREYSQQLGIGVAGRILHAIVKAMSKKHQRDSDDDEA